VVERHALGVDKNSIVTGEAAVTEVLQRLQPDFASRVPEEVIARIVAETAADFRDARVVTYVPLLVERLARERLASWVRAHVKQRLC
jgi:hypothetical protein